MASATLTYGKKRSLLRSLGSRRRQKHLTDSLHAKKPGAVMVPLPNERAITLTRIEPLALSISAASEASRCTPRKRSDHADRIDEMASRLLDSTSSLQDKALAPTLQETPVQAPKGDAAVSQQNTPEKLGYPVLPPISFSPLIEKLTTSPDARPRASRIEKHSPRVAGKASKRTSNTRPRTDSSWRRKESGLLRPLPQSKTELLDPLKYHPTGSIKTSSSVPLCSVDGNVPRKPSTQPSVIPREPSDADAINQKVNAMLAATNALKPSSTQNVTSSAAKFTRIVPSKVFAKVSNAWDRLHSKSSLQDFKSRGQLPKPDEKIQGLTQTDTPTHSPSSANESPISTIEIRLNEGDNLNKKKVQKIVGGQVVRKPVADDGKSLKSGKSMDDPFAEGASPRTATIFESRLKSGTSSECSTIPPLPCNPFESEKGFDNDIADRILSATPAGSSTPRIRVERISSTSPDKSPTAKKNARMRAEVDPLLDGVALRLGKEHFTPAKPLGLIAMKASHRLADPVRRTRNNSIEEIQDGDANGPKRMKKHPSPSKEALEDLEMALRKYTHLKVSGAKQNELDELASSYLAATPPLTAGDKKRSISNRLSTSNIEDVVNSTPRKAQSRPLSSASTIQLTRIPRPIENSVKLRAEIRLAPPYRPAVAHADDTDELH
ncbi:hypothetical protein G7046_g9158 [Stylonectria norvegica]|nr:hypothetical protein G7046_g9158 [Stylonectria norvegica]